MRNHVVIATKGRPAETAELVRRLAHQTLLPQTVVIVGVSEEDTRGIGEAVPAGDVAPFAVDIIHSGRAGASLQRNIGLDRVCAIEGAAEDWFVGGFDDDFRPATDWIEQASGVFEARPDVVGLTGQLLADGVKGPGFSDADADAFLSGERPRGVTWASWPEWRDTPAVYGCNMAFRALVAKAVRFDEKLPLYSWQEDRDYTGQALAHGKVIYTPEPKGVHLGVKSGRTSGVRMGYSQIANPLYLGKKGTMQSEHVRGFVLKALAANAVKSIRTNPIVDYRGRLRGNMLALGDLVRGRLTPERILDI